MAVRGGQQQLPAEAHLAMGEPHTVRLAIDLYETAHRLDPGNRAIAQGLENVRLLFESDYAR